MAVEGHPNLLVRNKRRRMVLTVELRHKKAAGNKLVTVTMTAITSPYRSATDFEGIAEDGSGKLVFVKLVPTTKTILDVNDAGYYQDLQTWEPVKATVDASRWWRVVCPFTSWSRKAAAGTEPDRVHAVPTVWVFKRSADILLYGVPRARSTATGLGRRARSSAP